VSAVERAPAAAAGDPRRPFLSLASGIATAIVLLALSILPFLTPLWIYPGQERAQADAWTGWSIETVHAVTGEVLVDLIIGPPAFDQQVDGAPVFDAREQGHLRDVRTVLIAFAVLAAIAAAVLAIAWWLGRGGTAAWRGVRVGAEVLAVAVVAIGLFSVVAFDQAFALFHALLFPGGSYTFDPATERLVQLFPESFWYETAIALGIVIIGLAIATIILATWRIRRVTALRVAAPGTEAAAP
jgi:integral membrane protein (TIGR01906 family)